METSVIIIDVSFNRVLTAIANRYGNLTPVMHDIGELYTKRVWDRFESETDPDGNGWIPTKVLSNYLGYTGTSKGGKRKAAYTNNGQFRAAFTRYLAAKKTLQLTKALRDDIRYQANATSVEIGTSGRIAYAGIHQFGGYAGRGKKVKIPARPYLARNVGESMEIAPADKAAIMGLLNDYLDIK